MKEDIRVGNIWMSKLNRCTNIIESFAKQLTDEDICGLLTMDEKPKTLLPANLLDSNNYNTLLKRLHKIKPDGFSNISNALLIAKQMFNKIDRMKYNCKVVILTDTQTFTKYNEENFSGIANEFYHMGIKISLFNVNREKALNNSSILCLNSNGYYYKTGSIKTFKMVHRELWNPTTIQASNIEITISANPNIEWDLNLSGFPQRLNRNGSVSILAGDIYDLKKIVIGYHVKDKSGKSNFTVKVKYTDKNGRQKVSHQETITVCRKDSKEIEYEDERVVYEILNLKRDKVFQQFWRKYNLKQYDSVIDMLELYKTELEYYNMYVTSFYYIEHLKKEADKYIKQCKKDSKLGRISLRGVCNE